MGINFDTIMLMFCDREISMDFLLTSWYLELLEVYFLFIYSHVNTLFRLFIPLPLSLNFSPLPPSVPGRSCSAFITNFVEGNRKS
jgi:hypothetical protein